MSAHDELMRDINRAKAESDALHGGPPGPPVQRPCPDCGCPVVQPIDSSHLQCRSCLAVWPAGASGAGPAAPAEPLVAKHGPVPRRPLLDAESETPSGPRNGAGTSRVVAPAPAHAGVLLDEAGAFVERFVRFNRPAQRVAVTLWLAHAHAVEAADSTPYLAVTSPEKRSGKTRLLEVLELLAPRPLRTANISTAALFRTIADTSPTLFIDEVDALFSRRGAPEFEDMRGLLNAGHRRGADVVRMVGQGTAMKAERFSVFGAKVLAGIGELPETVADRSIIIRLQRQAPGERVGRFRRRDVEPVAGDLRDRLAEWLAPLVADLREARPELPDELNDRAADGWEPLFAIANAARGDWPERARAAALELSAGLQADASESLGVRLLRDIRTAFAEGDADRMSTAAIIAALVKMDEAPWGDLRGKPLDTRTLARLLKQYDIFSRSIRLADNSTPKGFHRDQFEDAWNRYTAPVSPSNPPQRHNPHGQRDYGQSLSATSATVWRIENPCNPASANGCGGVADRTTPEGCVADSRPDSRPSVDEDRWNRMARDDGAGS